MRRQDGQSWADAVLAALDERVAIVSVPNVHWTDGAFVDLAPIAARSRDVGARLVIDGSQSVGALPLHVGRLRPDFLVTVGYKWLLGPFGVGYLYVAEQHRQGEPLEENWIVRAGSQDFARLVDYRDQYQPGARRFDVGERTNFELIPMAIAALEQILEWQVPRIAAALAVRTAQIARRASELGLTPIPDHERGPHMLGVRLPASVRERIVPALASTAASRRPRLFATHRAASAHQRRRRRTPRPSLDRIARVTDLLAQAVRTVIGRCLDVRSGDGVLVIADPDGIDLGRTLLDAALEASSDAALVIVAPDAGRGNEPPQTVASALAACDVFIAPCLPSLSHTTARKAATGRGARGATMPASRPTCSRVLWKRLRADRPP